MRLVKHIVCEDCLSTGVRFVDCVCTYIKTYPTIELEFEECECCGNIINDGNPREIEFNIKQWESKVNSKKN